jgi:CRISPR-associated endonuclease/helicase Cas3
MASESKKGAERKRVMSEKQDQSATTPPIPPNGLPFFVAHTPARENPQWHSLVDHTLGVADKARAFAVDLGYNAPAIAYYLGILHDLGKFTDKFQKYLRDNAHADKLKQAGKHKEAAAMRPQKGTAPHKQFGAYAAALLDPRYGKAFWRLPLYGHHSQMKSGDGTHSGIQETFFDEEISEPDAMVRGLLSLSEAVDPRLKPKLPDLTEFSNAPLFADAEGREMFVRLLYSCLTDADARDTEAHTAPDNAAARENVSLPTLQSLRDTLVTKQEKDFAGRTGKVNEIRREVYDDCRRVGSERAPGFFELTVPTGGGKTRSSLAFALEHAIANGLRRVIYAIPYTSIIDQTTDVFRDIFGADPGIVLEHHSAVDPPQTIKGEKQEDEEQDRTAETEQWRLLAAEDWEASIICTTTVQLFESLFSNRPGACRKLHRLAKSVIVLDEAQCLPAHLLGPIRSGLNALVKHFGATVVFCTATQPAHRIESRWMDGIEAIPIISDPAPHFNALRRVTWRTESDPWDWNRVAAEMRSETTSCITVVNTRKQALDLIDSLLPGDSSDSFEILHLSTLLCGAHRRDVIERIKRRLKQKDGPPILMVSTQVIEAGIDLSAPRLFRAEGPLERIIQAAGRCNREMEFGPEGGRVTVFIPAENVSPQGFYQRAQNRTRNLVASVLSRGEAFPYDDPVIITDYFAALYGDLKKDADAKDITPERKRLHYDAVAEKFRMIEQDTVSVVVQNYRPEITEPLLDKARQARTITRDLWRQLQPFTVSLYRHEVTETTAPEERPGLRVWSGAYDILRGIPLKNGVADVVMKPENSVW